MSLMMEDFKKVAEKAKQMIELVLTRLNYCNEGTKDDFVDIYGRLSEIYKLTEEFFDKWLAFREGKLVALGNLKEVIEETRTIPTKELEIISVWNIKFGGEPLGHPLSVAQIILYRLIEKHLNKWVALAVSEGHIAGLGRSREEALEKAKKQGYSESGLQIFKIEEEKQICVGG